MPRGEEQRGSGGGGSCSLRALQRWGLQRCCRSSAVRALPSRALEQHYWCSLCHCLSGLRARQHEQCCSAVLQPLRRSCSFSWLVYVGLQLPY